MTIITAPQADTNSAAATVSAAQESVQRALYDLAAAGLPKFTPEQERVVISLAIYFAQLDRRYDACDNPALDALGAVTVKPDLSELLAALEAQERGEQFTPPAGMIDHQTNPLAPLLSALDTAVNAFCDASTELGVIDRQLFAA